MELVPVLTPEKYYYLFQAFEQYSGILGLLTCFPNMNFSIIAELQHLESVAFVLHFH